MTQESLLEEFPEDAVVLRDVLESSRELMQDFEDRYGTDKGERRKILDYVCEGHRRSEDEADRRARVVAYERLDPLRNPEVRSPLHSTCIPNIEEVDFGQDSALLSAVDVAAYQSIVPLVEPFNDNLLKTSSYEAHIAGTVIYWDAKGEKVEFEVSRGDALMIPPNTIVFVQTQVEFTLPLYIGVRFNLRITHVHRGMLLGTGPLVDPGFRGRLLIPLHNLTNSEYWIDTSEALIWVEFTRTSYNRTREEQLEGLFSGTRFERRKRLMTPHEYLRRANGREPIRSSIPDVIENSQKAAERARKEVSTISFATVVALAIGTASFLGALYAAIGLAQDNSRVERLEDRVLELEARLRTTSSSNERRTD